MKTENYLNPTRFSAAAAAGLRVFPLQPQMKEPACKWTEYLSREPTADELAGWDASNFNIGIACGAASGIVALDVDSPEAQALVDALDLPVTPTVRTASGVHYYFKCPAFEVRNRVGINGVKLDVRSERGYVVGAGSIHPSGARYEWIVSPADHPFAEFPTQLADLLAAGGGRSHQAVRTTRFAHGFGGRFDRFLAEALGQAREAIVGADNGARNDTLFREGVRIARDVTGAGASWELYAEVLADAAAEVGLETQEIVKTLESCWKAGSAEPTPWMITAREWIYLSKADVFHHLESGEHVKVAAFNNTFASQRITKQRFSQFLLDNDFVTTVHDLDYQPETVGRHIAREGLTWLNTYRPSDVIAAEGDWSPFADFVSYLVPDEDERAHLLQMMAWTVRNPGKKLRHALLLRSEHQGIGKTMFTEIWSQLLGPHNVRKATTEEIQGQFQGFIKQTLLVLIEELNWGVGPIGYNRLKDLITGTDASVNEKFLPVRSWPNFATFAILTNLKTPLIIEDEDRRIFYIDTPAKPREKGYYTEFVAWWEDNLGVIRGFLDTIDLDDFNPFAPAPMTAAKQGLIAESRSGLAKDLVIAIEERVGVFERDIVTLSEVEDMLATSMRGKTKSELCDALESIGAIRFGQQRVPGRRIGTIVGKPERASLWALRHARYWEIAGAQARGEEYRRDEGMFACFGGIPIAVRHISEWPAEAGDPRGRAIETPMSAIGALELMAARRD